MKKFSKKVSSIAAAFVLMLPMFTIVFTQTAFAAGEPEITGGSNVSGLVDDYLSVTGLTITGDSVDPIPVSISVPNGQLSMTTTSGLSFSTPETGSTIAFTGNKTDINNALATLRYRTTRAQTVELTVSLTNPGLVYFPGNGHFYEIVNQSLDWSQAKVAAAARTVNGATGYLATVTTQEENDYISPRLSGDGWIGASDSETEGASENDWQWVTGPETGTSFWAGLSDGAPVNGLYSNWVDGVEPNNSGNEDCAQFYSNGSGWNDLPCEGFTLGSYVVEYGTEGVLPTAPSVRNLSITTSFPTPAEVPVTSCLDLIDAGNTNALDHRYDNLTLTQNIDCTGETVSPLFNDTDIDLGNLPFRGSFNGAGHTISNLVIDQNSSNDIGLFARTDGATISNVTVDSGSITGQNCVGGIVGQADNTTMNSVVSTNTVSGNDNIGGLVGCYSAISGNSNIDNSFSSGEITVSGESGGGIIGFVDVQDSRSFIIDMSSYLFPEH